MAGILVVDDQDVVRQGIKKILNEMEIGFSAVYEASDGEEALSLAKETEPEVILVDIMMPKLDGLQLIEKLKSLQSNAHIVIISAHNDFSFAKKAINFKVDDYILKPVSSKELYEVLLSVKSRIEQENGNAARLREQERRHYTKIFYDYLSGEEILIDIDRVLENIGDALHNPFYKIAVISVDNVGGEASAQIKQAVDQTLDLSGCPYISFDPGCGRLVYILNPAVCEDKNYELTLRTQLELSEVKINCGISGTLAGIQSLRELFIQSDSALKEAVFKGSRFYRFSEIRKNYLSVIKMNEYVHILDLFSRKSKEELDGVLNEFFQRVAGNTLLSASEAEKTFFNLISFLHANLSGMYPGICDMDSVRDMLSNARSVFGMNLVVRDVIDGMFEYFQESNKKDYSSYIANRIINIVRTRFQKEITLAQVSNELSMNYNYISGVFTKKTGLTFSEYLNRFRLEKAKELLREGNDRINEVALKCGFTDPKYFCRVFKKYFNITPSDFKDGLQ